MVESGQLPVYPLAYFPLILLENLSTSNIKKFSETLYGKEEREKPFDEVGIQTMKQTGKLQGYDSIKGTGTV